MKPDWINNVAAIGKEEGEPLRLDEWVNPGPVPVFLDDETPSVDSTGFIG